MLRCVFNTRQYGTVALILVVHFLGELNRTSSGAYGFLQWCSSLEIRRESLVCEEDSHTELRVNGVGARGRRKVPSFRINWSPELREALSLCKTRSHGGSFSGFALPAAAKACLGDKCLQVCRLQRERHKYRWPPYADQHTHRRRQTGRHTHTRAHAHTTVLLKQAMDFVWDQKGLIMFSLSTSCHSKLSLESIIEVQLLTLVRNRCDVVPWS